MATNYQPEEIDKNNWPIVSRTWSYGNAGKQTGWIKPAAYVEIILLLYSLKFCRPGQDQFFFQAPDLFLLLIDEGSFAALFLNKTR